MRLFFGLEIQAPWPEELPQGRLLAPEARHITLAFLGETDEQKLFPLLLEIPQPLKILSWSGQFTEVDFYPRHHPHVAAWNVRWLEGKDTLYRYQETLANWLKGHGFSLREGHAFNPHVTLCRAPFAIHEWKEAFTPLPFYTGPLHLYQSLGHSTYKPLWSFPMHPPFIEFEHTADIAFHIYGRSLEEIHRHAKLALAFKAPSFLNEPDPPFQLSCLDEIVKGLNWQIAQLDQKEAIPFKAVSYHGTIEQDHIVSDCGKDSTLLKWEMIVDV